MDKSSNKIPFEEALNKTGFGLYNYLHTILTGVIIIAFACVAYGATILVPASACELNTTPAQQGALAAVPFIGSILGAFTWGYLGDTRGRKNMLLICIVMATVFNSIASISVSWIMLMVFQFLATMMAAGEYTLSITLLSECAPMARRNVLMLVVASIFLLSQGIMALLAIPIIPLSFSYFLSGLGIYWNSWRTLMLVYCIPNVICGVCLLFFHESPKFLLMKDGEEKALEVLRAIYKTNKGKTAEEFDVKGLLPEITAQTGDKKRARDQILPLFKPPLLKFTAIMSSLLVFQQIGSFLVWMPTIANQFVQLLQTGEGSDLTLCGIIASALDAPVDPDVVPCSINATALLMVFAVGVLQSLINVLMALFVDKIGRRHMVMIVTSICGVCGIIVNLVPNAIGSALLFTVFMLGIIVVGLYTAISVAIFPTHVRAMALSVQSAMGRIATFATIQILNFMLQNSCEAGFYIFATIFTSSALMVFFLPDDRQLKRPPPEELVESTTNTEEKTT